MRQLALQYFRVFFNDSSGFLDQGLSWLYFYLVTFTPALISDPYLSSLIILSLMFSSNWCNSLNFQQIMISWSLELHRILHIIFFNNSIAVNTKLVFYNVMHMIIHRVKMASCNFPPTFVNVL